MAGPDVDFRISGDDKLLRAALIRSEKEVRKLRGELGGAGRAGRLAGKDISKAFSTNPLKSFTNILMGTGGVYMALRAITAELRQVFALQEKAAGSQVSLAAARSMLLRNMPMATEAEKIGMIQEGSKIAAETAVPETEITMALASALSASSGAQKASISAVHTAAKYLADQPEAIKGWAGALLDLSDVTESTNARLNQGLMSFVAGMSRIVAPQHQLMNIAPALIGQVRAGSTPAGAAAMLATVSTGLKDITGRRSGTAVIQLAEQLRAYRLGEGAFAKIRPSKRPTGETTGERLAALWADPKMAQTFMEVASFEVKARGVIRQLILDPTSKIAQTYKTMLTQLPDDTALMALGDKVIKDLYLDPLESIAHMKRGYVSATEQLLTTDIISATGEISRKGVMELLKTTGIGALHEKVIRARFEAATGLGKVGAIDVAQELLEERAEYLTRPYQEYTRIIHGEPIHHRIEREPTEREMEMAGVLRRQIEMLEGTKDILQRAGSVETSSLLDPQGWINPAAIYETIRAAGARRLHGSYSLEVEQDFYGGKGRLEGIESAIRQLESVAKALTTPMLEDKVVSQQDKEGAELLRRQVALLEELVDVAKQNRSTNTTLAHPDQEPP